MTLSQYFGVDADNKSTGADGGLGATVAFPKAGVKFSYIIGEFFDELGGRDRLQGLTTAQVCEDVIKPLTVQVKSSFCSILQAQGHAAYATTATVFVSHVHSYNFLDFIGALEWRLRGEPDTIVWIDLFSINQHAPMDWTFDWLSTTFKSAVELMGRTIMVMSPWDSPLPFTRAWCVFEAYCTTATGSEFEIALSKADERIFLDDMERDPMGRIHDMLSTISSRDSQCSVESDRVRILSVIRETVGFARLDSLVFERYRAWAIHVSLDALNSSVDEEERLKLLRSVGSLYMMQGKCFQAEKYVQDLVEETKGAFGNDHPDTLTSIQNLALVYHAQGHYGKAQRLYETCLERRKVILGENHPDTLQCMNHLGVLFYNQGKYGRAQLQLEACLKTGLAVLGRHDVGVMTSMKHLAVVYAKQGNDGDAEALFRRCRKGQQKTFAQDDPRGLSTMISLGAFLAEQGHFRDSQLMLAWCLNKLKISLGEDHPDTLRSMHNLADLFERLSKFDEALSFIEPCFHKQKALFGEDHPETLSSMNGLALVLFRKGLESSSSSSRSCSRTLLESCLGKRKAVLGEDHPDTIRTMTVLAMVLSHHGKIDRARELYESSYKKQKALLGEEHRSSIKTASSLEALRKQRHKKCLCGTVFCTSRGEEQ